MRLVDDKRRPIDAREDAFVEVDELQTNMRLGSAPSCACLAYFV